ncbi:MAG: CvpA family protein [Pseudomonadota bacterium]
MAGLDILLGIVIVLSAAIGLVRGLVKEVLSLVSWLLAFVIALYFAGQLASMLPASWGGESIRYGIAFVGLFVITLIATGIAQWLISLLITSTGLSGTDRLLGFLFGSVRGVVVAVVLLMGLREVAADAPWWEASRLRAPLLSLEDELRDALGRARGLAEELPASMPKVSAQFKSLPRMQPVSV